MGRMADAWTKSIMTDAGVVQKEEEEEEAPAATTNDAAPAPPVAVKNEEQQPHWQESATTAAISTAVAADVKEEVAPASKEEKEAPKLTETAVKYADPLSEEGKRAHYKSQSFATRFNRGRPSTTTAVDP